MCIRHACSQAVPVTHVVPPAGGYEYDGATEIWPLQAAADAATAAERVLQAGATAVAVCGVHAPMNRAQELAFAAELTAQLQQRAPGMPSQDFSSSQDLGGVALCKLLLTGHWAGSTTTSLCHKQYDNMLCYLCYQTRPGQMAISDGDF